MAGSPLAVVQDILHVLLRPSYQLACTVQERACTLGESILHAGRYLGINRTQDKSVLLQSTQSLCEGFL